MTGKPAAISVASPRGADIPRATVMAQAEGHHALPADYNAQVTAFRRVHEDLAILRVRPDCGRLEFMPGQYTVLGLGSWEPRIAGVQAETPSGPPHLIKRAYSICSSMLDTNGRLVAARDNSDLEFYVSLVRFDSHHAPALTPRLFLLSPGSRLFLGPHAHGSYTLRGVQPRDNIIFAATGTGEAPHNAMVAELLATGHAGRIVSITCVRYQRDLAYLAIHRQLEMMFSNYCYVPLTTREPWNLDPMRADFVGKRYLQDLFVSSQLEETCGMPLDPGRTHVFLCGNPTMIGASRQAHAQGSPTEPAGMIEILEDRGFQLDGQHHPGNVHMEKYWSAERGVDS